MRIFEVEIYRDGGSLEFSIERNGVVRHVWLETPLSGEPRALLIDSKAVPIVSPEVNQLLSDLDDWWCGLPDDKRALVLETIKHKGPYYSPSADTIDALNLRHVLDVRDYVRCFYPINT